MRIEDLPLFLQLMQQTQNRFLYEASKYKSGGTHVGFIHCFKRMLKWEQTVRCFLVGRRLAERVRAAGAQVPRATLEPTPSGQSDHCSGENSLLPFKFLGTIPLLFSSFAVQLCVLRRPHPLPAQVSPDLPQRGQLRVPRDGHPHAEPAKRALPRPGNHFSFHRRRWKPDLSQGRTRRRRITAAAASDCLHTRHLNRI